MASSHHQGSSDWTYVPARRNKKQSKHAPGTTDHISPETLKPRTQGLTSPAAILDEYRKIRTKWETTSCCQALRALVQSHPGDARQVTRAICLGAGTFDPPDGAWEARRRTYVQVIAFLVMVQEMETMSGRTIECVFQDPIFTTSDEDFLKGLGHQVVNSPQGCEMVTSQTFLYAIHLYKPIYALATKKYLPCVFAGTGWDVWDAASIDSPDDDLANMKKMEEEYGKSVFPSEEMATTFSSTSIYWKPSALLEESGADDISALLVDTHITGTGFALDDQKPSITAQE